VTTPFGKTALQAPVIFENGSLATETVSFDSNSNKSQSDSIAIGDSLHLEGTDTTDLDYQLWDCLAATENGQPVNEESVTKECNLFPGFVKASDVIGRVKSNDVVSKTEKKKDLLSASQLELKSWSLPEPILRRYHDLAITQMFDWQAECLLQSQALQGGNLIYSAPTSAGKTLVAELLLLKKVLETCSKALFILPFVSIAQEKTRYLKALFQDIGLRVEAFVGSQSPAGGLARVDVAVCTIEKANSLLNRLLEEGEMSQLGIIVVDELHMAGDPNRGYLLELLLTKVSFVNRSDSVQIVGMSATLPNLNVVAKWLNADLYHTTYRPVPLTEYIKIGNNIYNKSMKLISTIHESECLSDDPDHIVWLCQETLKGGHSVLIFCPTKNQTEKLAEKIAASLTQGKRGRGIHIESKGLQQIIEQLERTQTGVDCLLAKTLSKGVAFHHAGLTTDEREIIERGFRQSSIRVLTATSTLSSGVNLPARRVIIRSPVFHGTTLDTMAYQQMAGRAGRKGEDSFGESILVCKPSEKQRGLSLIQSSLEPVKSCLLSEESTDGHSSAMKRALLEVIASGVVVTPNDVERYTECTLLAAELKAVSKDIDGVKSSSAACLDFLHKNEFIALRQESTEAQQNNGTAYFCPTQLGTACLASALSPDEALVVLRELQTARKSFVLENELHLVYQVTPVFLQKQWPCPNWYNFLSLWSKLPPGFQRVADLVGVKESFLARAVNGQVPERTPEQRAISGVHRRFFTALALHDLVQEIPLHVVATRYGVSRGLLQSLQASAATFAGMVTVFCEKLSWHNMELLLAQFQSRLHFGIEKELCELVTISLLNGQQARLLYNAGYRSLSSIAAASPSEIEKTLKKTMPFRSMKDGDMGKTKANWMNRLKLGLTEAESAEEIVKEAQLKVQGDIIQGQETVTVTKGLKTGSVLTLKQKNGGQAVHETNKDAETNGETMETRQCKHEKSDYNEIIETKGTQLNPIGAIETDESRIKEEECCEHPEKGMQSNTMEGSYVLFSNGVSGDVNERECCVKTLISSGMQNEHQKISPNGQESIQFETDACEKLVICETPGFGNQACMPQHDNDNMNHSDLICGVSFACDTFFNSSPLKQSDYRSPVMSRSSSDLQTNHNTSFAILAPGVEKFEYFESTPVNASPAHPATEMVQGKSTLPACCISSKDALTATAIRIDCSVSPKQYTMADFSFGTMQLLEAACLEAEDKKSAEPEQENCEYVMEQRVEGIDDVVKDFKDNPVSKTHQSCQEQDAVTVTASPLDKQSTTISNTFSEHMHIEHTEPEGKSRHSVEIPLNSVISKVAPSRGGFCIIDVTADKELFESFLKEWKSQTYYSVSLACYRVSHNSVCQARTVKKSSQQPVGIPVPNSSERVAGIAVTWSTEDAYYLSLAPCDELADCSNSEELESSLREPHVANELSLSTRLGSLRAVLEKRDHSSVCVLFDVKEQVKKMLLICQPLSLPGLYLDPKVADWLLGPDMKEKNFRQMVLHYLPDEINKKQDGIGFLATNPGPPRVRACAQAVLSLMLMKCLTPLLKSESLQKAFMETEMPSVMSLARMEMNGIGFSSDECERQKNILHQRMITLEKEAYHLARRKFALSNPKDVSTVLFHELKLPPPQSNGPAKTTGKLRGGKQRRRLVQFSTANDVLEKLQSNHRLPGVIMEWRRIYSAVTKTIYPIQKIKHFNTNLATDRIHAVCQTHTATGRVIVCNPNLQNVPKEFDIGTAVTTTTSPCSVRVISHEGKIQCLLSPPQTLTTTSICMRNYFTASSGALLLAADYSQLELRLIAHLSQDKRLKSILSNGGDVFKMIASQWLSVEIEHVSGKERQQAKQICYGMIYGIGANALAEEMKASEEEVIYFMDSFKAQYSGLTTCIREMIMKCQQCGYVETLLGRKRYLPDIHSTNLRTRSHAERQAVNTTIQGSAADLVKMAMIKADRKLLEKYPPRKDKKRHGGMLVLQIHDELLYDVVEEDLLSVAKIVQEELEHAVELSVPLPVKLQVGMAWGSLESFNLDSN
jgi:DNA polymerase theta